MKFNRLCSMALAATIAVGVMAPGITAFADGDTTTVKLTVAAKNQYTMTIPSETALNTDGTAVALTNGLNIKGTNMTKNVVVTMTGAHNWTMTAEGKQTTIGYAVYESESSETALTKVEFDKAAIMEQAGSTKALYAKADAANVEAAEPGTYTGTITFTAELKDVVIYDKKESIGTLSSESLGTATTWTYNGVTYDVYNGFIPASSATSWNDAMGFVKALNDANYDGHSDWTLLNSEGMATAYAAGVMPDSSDDRGLVVYLWSSVDEGRAYSLRCSDGLWSLDRKSNAASSNGFVVLRGSSN